MDGDYRWLSLAYSDPPPLRRACHVHRRFGMTSRGLSASTLIAKKIKIFTLMGFSRGLRRNHPDAREQEFFRQPGPGLSVETAIASVLIGGTSIFGGRATILGTVFRMFHHRHGRSGPRCRRPHGRVGENTFRDSSSCFRSSSTYTPTNRSAGGRVPSKLKTVSGKTWRYTDF